MNIYIPVLPPLHCYWLLLKHLRRAVCVMVYDLNTHTSHQLLAKFQRKILDQSLFLFFLCQHWTSSWSWRGGTVHKKEADLHSLQRLCADVASKGQSGWKLCDYNDSKYVLSIRQWVTSPDLTFCVDNIQVFLHQCSQFTFFFSHFSRCCELQRDSEYTTLCKSGKKHCELPHSQWGPRWEADQRAEGGGHQASKAIGRSQSGLEKHGKKHVLHSL